MDSGSSESPAASLKRVASPAAKPAVSGEGENLSRTVPLDGLMKFCHANGKCLKRDWIYFKIDCVNLCSAH